MAKKWCRRDDFKGKNWLNEKHIEVQLQHPNLPHITNQYSSGLKKQRQELQNCGKYQPCRNCSREDFAIQVILDCRTTPAVSFRKKLGFNQQDPIMTQGHSVLTKIKSAFTSEETIFQHSVLGCRIEAYFLKHRLAVEVDERGPQDRDVKCETEDKELGKELGCKFIRINPAEEGSDIFGQICKIHHHIVESNKKLTKKSLIDKLSIKLLGLEFKSNNSIKTKCLQYIVKKNIA